jgi:hypothetical protein
MHGTMANPEMMQSMMGEMMKDKKPWLQMMQQGGMMSKECMQSSMKMNSKEKG